jgi:hypothetical protein
MTRGRSDLTNHHADEQQKCSVPVIPGWYDAVYLVPRVCKQSRPVECGPLNILMGGSLGPGAVAQIKIYMPLWRAASGGGGVAVMKCSDLLLCIKSTATQTFQQKQTLFQCTMFDRPNHFTSVGNVSFTSWPKSWFFDGLLYNVLQKKVLHIQTEDYHNRKLWCITTCKMVQQSHYRPGQALRALGG